jgi:hypothetical protein
MIFVTGGDLSIIIPSHVSVVGENTSKNKKATRRQTIKNSTFVKG